MQAAQAANPVPAIGLWDSIQQTGKQALKTADETLIPISKRISLATGHKFNLSKLIPITLALLITPMPIVLGLFAISTVVKIIHPSSFRIDPKLATNLAHGMGIHAAIYAIGYAIIFADPVLMSIHLGICTASFVFSKEMQNDGEQKGEGYVKAEAENLESAPIVHLPVQREGAEGCAPPILISESSHFPAPQTSSSMSAGCSESARGVQPISVSVMDNK